MPRGADSAGSRISLLHVLTLFALAVAQPLYDLLGQPGHAPFFVAHQSRAVDIWLLVACLSLVLPAILWLMLWLLERLASRFAAACYALLLLGLFLALFLPLAERGLPESPFAAIALAGVSAAIAAAVALLAAPARTFLTFMSPVIVLSPLLFLANGSIRSHLSASGALDDWLFSRARDLPDVVMIVFDELPLFSLLDDERGIDAARFPNFRRLAETATWYRNATSIDYATAGAITSLLVGGESQRYLRSVHPDGVPSQGPIDRARFPSNLFSLLEKDFQVFAVELTTKLARNSEAAGEFVPPLSERLRELFEDASVLYGHSLLPASLRHRLPVMEGQWRGFLAAATPLSSSTDWPYADSHGRIAGVRQLFDSLQQRDAPSFYFLHSLLPHYPFVFNERGQLHANKFSFLTMHFREATGSNDWPDATTARLVYQAHLLQLRFTDRLLGAILDRLVERDLFDEALVIVTSDHGTSFYWDSNGLRPEELVEVQASGTMYVPWLLKLPGQTEGAISDTPVRSIDILPTIADILHLEIPWEIEGVSALAVARATPGRYAYLPERIEFDDVVDPKRRAPKHKLELFGSNSTDRLYRVGPHPELIGEPVASFSSSPTFSTATLALERPAQYRGVDPAAPRLPAYVEGRIEHLPSYLATTDLAIALAVNGVIRNTTNATRTAISSLRPQIARDARRSRRERVTDAVAPGTVHFLVRVPPRSLEKGRNEVTIHAVLEDGDGRPLSLLEIPPTR